MKTAPTDAGAPEGNGQLRPLGTKFRLRDNERNKLYRGCKFIITAYTKDDPRFEYVASKLVKGKPTKVFIQPSEATLSNPDLCEILPEKIKAQAPDTGPRPQIEITTEAHVVRDLAVAALTHDERIFCRGDVLTMVITSQEQSMKLAEGVKLDQAKNTAIMAPIDHANMMCFLSQNTNLYKMVKDKNGIEFPKDCLPPGWLIDAILARKIWPGIRELLTLTECPYLRKDGTIAFEAGYDPITRSILTPRFTLPSIPDRLTLEDAEQAVKRLLEPLGQFPFKTDDDRVVWIAALLTAIQRPMIMGPVPGFVFNGNKAGCGKELLINLIGQLVWGKNVPTSPYPYDAVEADKVALALALFGVQAVHLDNVREGYTYGNSGLDSAVTSTVREGRILGTSGYAKDVPLRPWWAISGNNISPGSDAYRRWLLCNLETELDAPHERDDLKILNLADHFRTNRPGFVRDALIILRAHVDAGRPGHGRGKLGSFGEWDDAVRAPLFWATGIDCLETQRQAAKDSPEYIRKLVLLQMLHVLGEANDNGLTCAEILEKADYGIRETGGSILYQRPGLRNALMEFSRNGHLPTQSYLGYAMRGMATTRFGEYKLTKVDCNDSAGTTWRVVKIE